MSALVFLCVHLYRAPSEGTLTPGTVTTSAWVRSHRGALVTRVHTPRDRRRGEDWGTQGSLPMFLQRPVQPELVVRPGRDSGQLSPPQLTLAVPAWRLCPDELVPPMGLELPLPTPPALLCRLALGHRNSQHQLVWKYITNFFQEKDERTEEKLLFSKFITQQNLGEFLWKKKMHFHSSRDSFCNISKAGCKHQQCRTSQWQKVLNGPNRWVSIDSSGSSTVLHQPGDAGISSQVSRGLLWLLGLCVWVSLVLSAAVCSVMGGVCDLFCFHLV